MKIVILHNAEAVAAHSADILIKKIQKKADTVLGLATGSTPLRLYNKLIEANHKKEISFAEVTSFNLDEYLGLSNEHPQSYYHFMQEHLFKHIDIHHNNTYLPPGDAKDPIAACKEYDALIKKKNGIDIQLLGIGRNGHIGFNEPSSGLASRTRIKTLTPATIADNARFFKEAEFQPQLSMTMGIGTIMESKKILLLATGKEKADAVYAAVEGAISASCPASALQMHQDTVFIIDNAAAEKLQQKEFYKHIERVNQKLTVALK